MCVSSLAIVSCSKNPMLCHTQSNIFLVFIVIIPPLILFQSLCLSFPPFCCPMINSLILLPLPPSIILSAVPLLLCEAVACPPNSSYTLCMSSCPETCLGVVGPPGCEDVCVEGCQCDPGFVLSDDKCVALKDCGCVDTSGSYHPVSWSTLRVTLLTLHLHWQ